MIKVSQSAPDLVLRDGYGVLAVYLTTYVDKPPLTRIDGTEPGGYVLKPFKLSELRKSIESALSDSSAYL